MLLFAGNSEALWAAWLRVSSCDARSVLLRGASGRGDSGKIRLERWSLTSYLDSRFYRDVGDGQVLCVCVPAFIDDPSILLVNMEELEEAEKLRSQLCLSLFMRTSRSRRSTSVWIEASKLEPLARTRARRGLRTRTPCRLGGSGAKGGPERLYKSCDKSSWARGCKPVEVMTS